MIRLTCFPACSSAFLAGQVLKKTPRSSPCRRPLWNRTEGKRESTGGSTLSERDCKGMILTIFLKKRTERKQTQRMCYAGTDRTDTNKTCQEWKTNKESKPTKTRLGSLEKCSGDFRRPLEGEEGTTSQMYLFIWMRRTRRGRGYFFLFCYLSLH